MIRGSKFQPQKVKHNLLFLPSSSTMANRAPPVERDDDALFVKDGRPVKFFFHESVRQGRSQITRDVEVRPNPPLPCSQSHIQNPKSNPIQSNAYTQRHGGKIVSNEQRANVLLVDEQVDLAFFRRRYYSSTERYRLELYVEPRGFVQACIRAGSYQHVAPAKRRMPGRPPGAGPRVRV